MEDPEKKKKEDKAREKQLKKGKFILKQAERQEQRLSHATKKNEMKNVKHGEEDDNCEDYVDPETPSGDKKVVLSDAKTVQSKCSGEIVV